MITARALTRVGQRASLVRWARDPFGPSAGGGMRFILRGFKHDSFICWKLAVDLYLLAAVDIQLASR